MEYLIYLAPGLILLLVLGILAMVMSMESGRPKKK